MTKIERLQEMGKGANFYVADYSPGDGVTRYRFMSGTRQRNYFNSFGNYTALGFKEALAYATGRCDGRLSKPELAEQSINRATGK